MLNQNIPKVGLYLDALAALTSHHSPGDRLYPVLKSVAQEDFQQVFGEFGPCEAVFSDIGNIKLPYFRMGTVDSVNLFDLDELIIFTFYRKNKGHYRRVADIGANIGLHTIMLAKLGYHVTSYEPDPIHNAKLVENLAINKIENVNVVQAAVSDSADEREFIRILGNTTGSHLAGAKSSPYGEQEKFDVTVLNFKQLIGNIDLVKLDAEGEESRILCVTDHADWLNMDAVVEVGTEENAASIFSHFQHIQINLFSQKHNWLQVRSLADMPFSYRDGSLFISNKPGMPW
ncbi:MAG: FkbM family methyltransferase [Desulfatirhabdiaceae bacterium]